MDYKNIIKKDYFLILFISVLYFLTAKNVMPVTLYLAITITISIYIFPAKLFIGDTFFKNSKKKNILASLSYFITSNIIALTALVFFQDDTGFIHTALSIYGLINFGLLIYFYMSENISYNFMLSCCVLLLTSAKFVV